VKAPAPPPPPAHLARLILILSLAPTIGLGIGRFADQQRFIARNQVDPGQPSSQCGRQLF